MTTPPPPQQAPPQQAPVPPPSGLDDPALAVTVAAVLAGGVVTLAPVIAALKAKHALTVAELAALSQVLGDVTAHPPPLTGVIGAASARTARMNTARRAQYVLAAAKRVMGAARDARSKGEPVTAATRKQLATEQRYYAAASGGDVAAGPPRRGKSTWRRRSTAGCLGGMRCGTSGRQPRACRADGCNFYVDNPPDIGLPGIGPHVGCRCFPGPAHPGGRLLPGSGPGYARAA